MASVNITCAACNPRAPCERCSAIVRAVRSAGHAVTQTTRYDALRAAAVGAYGFDACVMPIAEGEHAVVDAAQVLLTRSRVALVVPSGAREGLRAPSGFVLIEDRDFRDRDFPTDWIAHGGVPATRAPAPDAARRSGERDRPALDSPAFDAAALAGPPFDAAKLDSGPLGGAPASGASADAPALDVDLDAARRRLRHVARGALREIGAAGYPEDQRLDLLAVLEDEIAWAKMSGTGFGLVLIHVAGARGQGRSSQRRRDRERIVGALRDRIRVAVRAGDVVSQSADSVMAVFAEADLEQTGVAEGRIKKALRKAFKEAGGERSAGGRITLGSAVYPPHGTTRTALLARATAAASDV